MDTVSISGVEILRIGRWNGREYTGAELDAMVASFHALRGVYDPPAKLGHNADQHLLASDGLPAAGWVANLYRKGTALVADFREVPAKVAALIQAGAYRKRSAEIWFNTKFEETVYPAVLKAVSWLGADAPAVSGLSDVFEMYADAEGRDVTVLTYEPSFDARREAVWDALGTAYPYDYDEMGDLPESAIGQPSPSIREIYDDRVIVSAQGGGAHCWAIPYTIDASGKAALGAPSKVGVEYVPIPPASSEAQNSRGGMSMDLDKLRVMLGLKADADEAAIEQAVLSLKATHVELSEHQSVKAELAELTKRWDEREAGELVERALRDGKLAPRQKEWAQTYCLSDRKGFEAYLANAPKVIEFGERGSAGPASDPAAEDLPKSVPAIADKMGLTASERAALTDKRPLSERVAAGAR